MSVASFVVACALDLMGRSAAQLPPIILVTERPADASTQAVAFVRRGERAIYLITSSTLFQAAMDSNRNTQACRQPDHLRFIASVIAHEQWHIANGPDEEGAYYAQLTELQRLGSGPGRWPYETARRAMVATRARDASRRQPAGQLASAARPGVVARGMSSMDRPWPGLVPEPSRLPIPRR